MVFSGCFSLCPFQVCPLDPSNCSPFGKNARGDTSRCWLHVQSNSVPSRLLPNSCLLNPGRGPKSNRASRLFPGSSKGKATKFVRSWVFSKLTRFRNTENLVNPFCLDMDAVKILPNLGLPQITEEQTRVSLNHAFENGPFLAEDKNTVYQKHSLCHPDQRKYEKSPKAETL